MTYTLKNKLLAYPSDWFVEEKTINLVKSSLPQLAEFYRKLGDCEPITSDIRGIIDEPLKDVYTIPLFSEKFCQIIRDEIEHIKKTQDFVPNKDEDELRQIPEFILQEQCPQLYESLFEIVRVVLNPVFMEIWGRTVNGGGIQLANYSPKNKKKGAWHHDASSDITVVVPLNTGDYEGGGTEFYRLGIVPPLPSGSALIFPGFTHMHRGLSVTNGDRYLMVFWLTHEENDE